MASAPAFPGDSSPDGRVAEYVSVRCRGMRRVEVSPLSGDASTRRYYRVRHEGGSLVLSVYPDPFEMSALPFAVVGELLRDWGVPVPGVCGHDGARGIMALEDLGDLTLQEALRDASAERVREHYTEAIEQLARLQREAARAPADAECFRVAFDIEKLGWELHYFEKHFLEGLRGCDLSVEDRARLAEAFHALAQEIAAWPRVLCHRDYHSRNLMLHRERLVWIDFQDARMGPATYDLASLLRDSYVELPEAFVEECAEEFRALAVPGEAREVFRRRFERMAVQRNLKALGTFGYMATVRGNQVYLPYIPRTLASVRRNLSRDPELAPLRRVLARHVEELA